MSAAWVLERARESRYPALKERTDLGHIGLVDASRGRATGSGLGALRYLFRDKHHQRNGRYQLPSLLQQGHATAASQEHVQELAHAQLKQKHVDTSKTRCLQAKHKALTARLAAAAERQQRRQQRQRQEQRHLHEQQTNGGRHGSWSDQVAADIELVCKELKMPPSVAAALSRAAAKGHISCNPGILLSQLVRLLPVEPQLSALVGQADSLAAVLAAQPTLLHVDPLSLQANCQHLQELLGHKAAAAAVKRCPQVLSCSPFRISANLSMLQDLLGFSSSHAAAAVAVRQPMLLLCTPDNLQCRWQQLQQLLPDVSADKLGKQLRRTPELLLMRPSTLAAKLKCLELLFAPATQQLQAGPPAAAVLGGTVQLERPTVSTRRSATQQQQQQLGQPLQQQQLLQGNEPFRAIGQQRVLRVYKQHELSYRLQRLQQLAQQHTAGAPWCSNYGYGASQPSQPSSSQLSAPAANAVRHTAAAAVDARVQHLALKVPGLLSLNPCTLHQHVTELQLLLCLQADDPRLTRLVLLQPGLLTQAPRTLANKLQLLQHLTGRGEDAVHEMVLRCPAVLTLSTESVTRKWMLLQECLAACGTWQQQLAEAPPVSVAMMLCYSIQRLQRLQYVVQLARQQRQQQQQRQEEEEEDQQERPPCQRQQGRGSVAPSLPPTCAHSSSSSSSNSGASAQRRRRRQTLMGAACAAAGEPGEGVLRQSARCKDTGVVEVSCTQQGQLPLDLATVPWKSVVQETDAAFLRRFSGYKAWQQQQQQQQD